MTCARRGDVAMLLPCHWTARPTAATRAGMTLNRRTFAIIAHPDAGKTTLTEKRLMAGGAIHLAGEVKARGAVRRARSDWMKIE